MAAKHTPGPWIVRIDEAVNWPRVAGPVKANGKRDVVASFPIKDSDTTHANARLIAAAPDLLAACRAVLADCKTYYDSENGEAYLAMCSINDLAASIAAAIAKAAA